LAVRYGTQALPFLAAHKLQVAVALIVLISVSYALSRVVMRAEAENVPPE
jgi:hypothetical protein